LEKEITIKFDMKNKVHRRVYFALKELPKSLDEPNLSEAIITLVDNMINAIAECEQRTARCQEALKSILGKQSDGSN